MKAFAGISRGNVSFEKKLFRAKGSSVYPEIRASAVQQGSILDVYEAVLLQVVLLAEGMRYLTGVSLALKKTRWTTTR